MPKKKMVAKKNAKKIKPVKKGKILVVKKKIKKPPVSAMIGRYICLTYYVFIYNTRNPSYFCSSKNM